MGDGKREREEKEAEKERRRKREERERLLRKRKGGRKGGEKRRGRRGEEETFHIRVHSPDGKQELGTPSESPIWRPTALSHLPLPSLMHEKEVAREAEQPGLKSVLQYRMLISQRLNLLCHTTSSLIFQPSAASS